MHHMGLQIKAEPTFYIAHCLLHLQQVHFVSDYMSFISVSLFYFSCLVFYSLLSLTSFTLHHTLFASPIITFFFLFEKIQLVYEL